jgi:nucleoside-diphosphate-sugar epimerase
MRALVAGGAGFIGSNFCAALLSRGYEVTCVDSLITGDVAMARRLAAMPRLRFVEGDVSDQAILAELVQDRFDDVYNLACPTGVPNIAVLGEEMLLTSSVGSQNLLKLALRCGSRYLFASSAEVYGDAQVIPQPETYTGNVDPVGDRSAYEEGKRFGEALTICYYRKYGIDARVVRIFNTYGPGMSFVDQRVIPRLIVAAAEAVPFTIFGDGSQTRSFLYVEDLVEGIFVAVDKGVPGEVYNLGSSREHSILELHSAAEASLGKVIEIAFKEHFISDQQRRCADVRKMRELGWEMRTDLREGLKRSFDDAMARRNRTVDDLMMSKAATPHAD